MSLFPRFMVLAVIMGLNSGCNQTPPDPSLRASDQDSFEDSPFALQTSNKENIQASMHTHISWMGNTLQHIWLPYCAAAWNRTWLCGSPRVPDQTPSGDNLGEIRRDMPKTMMVELGDGVMIEFILIPAGMFTMGSPKDEEGRFENEIEHKVEITRSFYLGKYEVTQEQYKQIMGNNPSYFCADGGGKIDVKGLETNRFPVEQVSWYEATEFCRRLAKRDRERRYSLPTEAEWEYACRAGTRTAFHFGSTLKKDKANCDNLQDFSRTRKGPFLGRTCPVGLYAANAFGLHDMHGNVGEWCADRYEEDYCRNCPLSDPKGPQLGTERVVRGGSFGNDPEVSRAAYRQHIGPSQHRLSKGFRVAFRLR